MIKDVIAAYEAARAKMLETVKKEFNGLFADLFNDDIESINFKAYRIYFNDGEECTFSVYNDVDNIEINEINMGQDCPFQFEKLKNQEDINISKIIRNTLNIPGKDSINGYGLKWNEEDQREAKIKRYLAAQEFCNRLGKIPADVIRDMFGEHVSVTITKDNVSVEEYTDHD